MRRALSLARRRPRRSTKVVARPLSEKDPLQQMTARRRDRRPVEAAAAHHMPPPPVGYFIFFPKKCGGKGLAPRTRSAQPGSGWPISPSLHGREYRRCGHRGCSRQSGGGGDGAVAVAQVAAAGTPEATAAVASTAAAAVAVADATEGGQAVGVARGGQMGGEGSGVSNTARQCTSLHQTANKFLLVQHCSPLYRII